MARSPVAFQDAFDACCAQVGYTRTQIDANPALKADLLRQFNRSYQIGYDVPGAPGWDDARVYAQITPEDSGTFIDFETLGDAREFAIWEANPRTDTATRRLEADADWTTDINGIKLRTAATTVYVGWIPETVKFTTTAWAAAAHDYAVGDRVLYTTSGHNYRCIEAHSTTTGSVFADDLSAGKWVLVPVLGVLEEFIQAHMQGQHLIKNNEAETGFAMQQAAEAKLELKALAEIQRNNRSPL